MIYEVVNPKNEICQGDIFFNLPYIDVNLEHINVIIDGNSVEEMPWTDISNESVSVIADLQRVNAIVVSQDCDCLRENYITLAVISKWEKL